MRELDNRFYEACNTTALLSLEKYGQDGSDLDALPEDARTLLQDKDTLLNAVQASAVLTANWKSCRLYTAALSSCSRLHLLCMLPDTTLNTKQAAWCLRSPLHTFIPVFCMPWQILLTRHHRD